MDLHQPIKEAGFVYRMKSSLLQKLEIFTPEDLLYHLPFRYEDFTNAVKIRNLRIDTTSCIKGVILEIKNEYTKRRFALQKATLQDETGTITCVWFNQKYLTRVIKAGDEVGLVGKLGFEGRNKVFKVEEYELLSKTHGIHTSGLVPVYSETRGISSKWLRNRVFELLSNGKENFLEFLPSEVLKKENFDELYETLNEVHFPKSLEKAALARNRLAFNELLLAQMAALKRRYEWEEKKRGIPFQISNYELQINNFISSLPFELTDGQKQAVEEIKEDLKKEIPMNRLLEGDVGSGKTIVASIAMYISYLNGYQSVLMAPTEILAEQHFETISKLFTPLNLNVDLITGSKKTVASSSKKLESSKKQKKHNSHITIGTHALIQKGLQFENLGLVVIDEQQRFGVEQRAILREKGNNPHFLTMTATPIPRTVLLAIYKDLDVSLLKELPKGRKHIKTWLVPNAKRENAYKWIEKQIIDSDYKDQAFIVCPFIEESESATTVKAATSEFEHLQKDEFKLLKLGLLHGKLKAKDKNEILQQFHDKKINILVATPVVEVGIDIPDATIMLIEAADRFGLSQLHQLRGRVGRGDKQSYCLLFSESFSPQTLRRLKFMETAHSGFELAELDLKLRGPGDMYGTRQHGLVGFKIADFSNFELVEKAKKEANVLFKDLDKNNVLKEKVETVSLKLVHPD